MTGMRRLVLFALLASSCLRMKPIAQRHPAGWTALVALSPECEKPAEAAWTACDAAAAILETDAPHATPIFLEAWNRAAFGQSLTDHRYTGVSADPLGDADLRRAETRAISALKRIALPALKNVCAREHGRYPETIAPALDAIVFRSHESYEALRKAHDAALAAAAPPRAPSDDDDP